MPNYLARVAAAGARTPSQSTAKPPVPAPPVLPGGITPGIFAPAIPEQADSGITVAPVVEAPNRQPTEVTPAQPGDEPVAAVMQSRLPAPDPVTPAPPPARPEPVHAPRVEARVEQAPPPVVVEQIEVIRMPKLLREAAFAAPTPAPIEQLSSAESQASETIIRAPHSRSRLEAGKSTESESEQPIAAPPAPVPPQMPEQPDRQATNPATAPVAIPPRPQIRIDVSPQIHPAGEVVLPVEPRDGGNRRQTKITVGRIDVQVTNHPQATPTASPRPQRSEWRSDPLEVRFLSRFQLRP